MKPACLLLSLLALVAAAAPIRIERIPHIRQKPDFCGEACVAMYLQALGRTGATQDYVFNQSGLDPALGRGCYTAELVTAIRRIGFNPGPVYHWVSAASAADELTAQWQALLDDLRRGIPSIVCMHYSPEPDASEHFRLIVGYDPAKLQVIFHEPAIANGAYQRMSLVDFLAAWPLKYKRDQWLAVRLRLEPNRLPDKILAPDRFTDADYAQHVHTLRQNLPAGFTVVVQKPFIVLGDEAAKTVQLRAERTVGWAVSQLKTHYFARDPDHIIDIWLFKDKTSYEHHAASLFHDTPDTPYGYYSARHRALIMNIATGGGTLIHEIVHPFMDANFPACPAWFNEGLASLYEQCAERKGTIIGLTNWRLAGLQKAIEAKRAKTFKELTATTTDQFYGRGSGTHYAEARYILYYLQERGLLLDYYKRFRADAATDPTGYDTLQAVLGKPDMADFQQTWEQYTLKLRFP